MAIQGAIFDCDGTLLDSMPMWTSTCVGLLRRYGVRDAERVFAEHESLDMDKKCYWYHDNLGIGESGEALYHELWTMVERAYQTEVRPFAGCKAFLDELARAGVPMVIASSTPTALLRAALAAHGLLDYFTELVFAGDVGRGKEYADVYLESQRRLGTPRADTWVFEDAPFGVRSAARAGFPVMALFNDHDGRDEAFLRTWATIVTRGYEDVHPAQLSNLVPHVMKALVINGSPEPSSTELVTCLAKETDWVVAADRGSQVACSAGIDLDLLCGDADSARDEALEWARSVATSERRFPVEKDDTDLALAIACAAEEAERRGSALRLTVTCASGGRPDHALAVWGVLTRYAQAAPRMIEDGFECRILAPEGEPTWHLEAMPGQTISAIALVDNTVVSAQGVRWPLDHVQMPALSDYGVSNRAIDRTCELTCHSGILAVFLLRG